VFFLYIFNVMLEEEREGGEEKGREEEE